MSCCWIVRGLFGRFYLLDFNQRRAPVFWTGSRWERPDGLYQLCNFATEEEAQAYCDSQGLTALNRSLAA